MKNNVLYLLTAALTWTGFAAQAQPAKVLPANTDAYSTAPKPKPKGGGNQPGAYAGPLVADLLKKYPDAVSIEIRFDKQKDYDDAVDEYDKRQFATTPPQNIKDGFQCRSYPYYPPPSSGGTAVEFLLVYTKGMTELMQGKGVIAYVAWSSIITKSAMDNAYGCALTTGEHDRDEIPGHGSVGGRDVAKGTVRATLKKSGQGLIKGEVEGVIINPPVP